MNISEPKVGAQYKLDGQIYEIISIDDGLIAMCSLIHQYRRFIERDLFASMEQKGKLLLHQRASIDITPAVLLASMPEPQKQKVQARHAYLQACEEQLGGRLPRVAAKVMIKQVSDKIHDNHPPSVTTLWRWKCRYLANNRNPLSLLRLKTKPRQKRVSASSEELMKHYIKTVYLQRERPSLTHAYRLLKGHIAKENRDRLRYDNEPQATPSYATFRRRVVAKDSFYVLQQREGSKAARKLTKFSGELYIDDDPFACTAYDTHDLNVDVRDQKTGIVGRALLSAHVVPATRENSGWDISLGAPCAEKMMRATIGAIINNGKMAGIIADHGSEILNNWAITTFQTLGINPDYVPVGDPDAKAIMERFFGTVSTGFSNNLPGTTKGCPAALGDYPSKERACLSIEQLRTAYESWLEVYHNTWHDGLYTSPAKKKAQLSALAPPAEQYTEEELKRLCVSRWYLRLNGGRVHNRKLKWFGPGLPEVRLKLKRNQKAMVYYNPCDLGTVWVAHPDTPDDWHPAIATNPKYQNGLTLSDHEVVVKQISTDKRSFNEDIALIKLYELNEYVQECQQDYKNKCKTKNKKTSIPATRLINDKIDTVSPVVSNAGIKALDDSDFGTFYTNVGDDNEPGN